MFKKRWTSLDNSVRSCGHSFENIWLVNCSSMVTLYKERMLHSGIKRMMNASGLNWTRKADTTVSAVRLKQPCQDCSGILTVTMVSLKTMKNICEEAGPGLFWTSQEDGKHTHKHARIHTRIHTTCIHKHHTAHGKKSQMQSLRKLHSQKIKDC